MIPRIRAVALSSYVDVARMVGLDPFRMMNDCRVSATVLGQPEAWMGAPPAIMLLERSAAMSGRHDFGILMAECRTFASLGPLSLLLPHVDNARAVITEVNRFRHLLNELSMIGLEERGQHATIRCEARSEFAGFQTISLITAMTHLALSGAVGEAWRPDCVHFAHERPADIQTFERYFDCRLQFSSGFDGITCSVDTLSAPNPRADATMAGHARDLLQTLPARSPADSIADRARYAISLLLSAGEASINGVAANLGMSARTLQRSLGREKLTFARLLNDVRRQRAAQYLRATSLQITEIAFELGYSAGSAFTRWFTREFGETPMAFRGRAGGRGTETDRGHGL